jgi:hypothetical protein
MSLIRQTFPDPAARARAVALWATGGAMASSASATGHHPARYDQDNEQTILAEPADEQDSLSESKIHCHRTRILENTRDETLHKTCRVSKVLAIIVSLTC